jgi:hypothetical protein
MVHVVTGARQDQLEPTLGRTHDRRFWLAWNVGFGLCALGSALLADSWILRIGFGFAAATFAFEAAHRWTGMRRHGRWMDPSNAASSAELHRRRRLLAAMVAVALLLGLIVGIAT